MRKILLSLIIVAAAISSAASFAASVPDYCDTHECKPGGPTRAFNVTTKQFEMVPQCFPWIWMSQFAGLASIGSAIENQNACRVQRSIDFPGY